MTGFETAFNEISLVFFTALAPSGVVAYCLMAVALLRSDGSEARRLNAMLLMPFLVCLAGLVASATHLGNPDNALYVFSRVGQSPLSNEVFAAVLFLGAAGCQWLYQFAEHARRWLSRVLLVAAIAAGAVFLAAVAMAYASRTVVTWDTPLVPLALVLNAFTGGPLLALTGFAFARNRRFCDARAIALMVVSFGALAVNAVVYAAQSIEFAGLGNGVVSVAELAPGFDGAIAVFCVLCLAGIVVDAVAVFRSRRLLAGDAPAPSGSAAPDSAAPEPAAPAPAVPRFALAGSVVAVLLAFCGIFVMRFMFYMTHMTVGISL